MHKLNCSITLAANRDTLQRNNCNQSINDRFPNHNAPLASLNSLYPILLSLLGIQLRQPHLHHLNYPVTRPDRSARPFTVHLRICQLVRIHNHLLIIAASLAFTTRIVLLVTINLQVSCSCFVLFYYPLAGR